MGFLVGFTILIIVLALILTGFYLIHKIKSEEKRNNEILYKQDIRKEDHINIENKSVNEENKEVKNNSTQNFDTSNKVYSKRIDFKPDLKEIGGIILMIISFIFYMMFVNACNERGVKHPKDHDMGTFENYDGSFP